VHSHNHEGQDQLMMRLTALLAAAVLAGCASTPSPQTSYVVRSRPPVNVEATISSYFDLTIPDPKAQRKLAFGTAETSKCPLSGSAGAHLGWVVPVIYDTSPPSAANAKGSATTAKAPAVKMNAAPPGTAATVASASGTGTVTLSDVSITGDRYFFWFSSDTISAVTRRADLCP
jgi:hypothetical protein